MHWTIFESVTNIVLICVYWAFAVYLINYLRACFFYNCFVGSLYQQHCWLIYHELKIEENVSAIFEKKNLLISFRWKVSLELAFLFLFHKIHTRLRFVMDSEKTVSLSKCQENNPVECGSLQSRHNERDGVSKSLASRVFTQPFVQAKIKENIKAPRRWPLWGGFTGDFPAQRASNAEMFPFYDVI